MGRKSATVAAADDRLRAAAQRVLDAVSPYVEAPQRVLLAAFEEALLEVGWVPPESRAAAA